MSQFAHTCILQSKFDVNFNPAYQVDFHQEASGKRVSGSKRRVRFRFGFSNKKAIAEGRSGTECRGEEHEVSLVWSLTSGKRLVMADGQEVHFSQGKRTESKFETCWSIPGGSMLKLIAHAAPPLFHTPGFRQFDLLLDGMSFFEMPKIYQLGATKPSAPVQMSRYEAIEYSNNYPTEPTRVTPTNSVDLLDFETPVRPNNLLAHDEYAPVEPPKPTYDDISKQILGGYSPTSTTQTQVLALANEPHTYSIPQQPVYHQPVQTPQRYQYYNQQPQSFTYPPSQNVYAGYSY